MKKVILISSVLALLLVLTMSVSAASGTASVMSSGDVSQRQEITFTVTISDADPVLAAMIEPVYDDSVFELVSGSFLKSGVMADFSGGNGVIAWSEPTDINGALLTFTLRVKDTAVTGENYTVGCTYTVRNAKDDLEPGKVSSATVTIQCRHSYESVVTAPTCTEGGYTTYTCACGDVYIADETAPLGHDWQGTECVRCGEKRESPFADVPEDSFYYDPVLWAVEEGITNGATATTFGPGDQCMRAHVVTFLWRAAGSPEPTATRNSFTDVKETDFYYKAVLWAVENGITAGMDATHFGPTAYCNRAQVVTFLYRTIGSPAVDASRNPFADVPTGQWFTAPVLWAVENGITNGLSATTFGPNTVCNRAQIVTFLYRAFED